MNTEYASRGLALVTISVKERDRKVQDWSAARRLSFTTLLDPEGSTAAAYGVTGFPTLFIVGRDGTLHGKRVGTIQSPWTRSAEKSVLDVLVRPESP